MVEFYIAKKESFFCSKYMYTTCSSVDTKYKPIYGTYMYNIILYPFNWA